MSKFIIQGGKQLKGTVKVAGNKNAVLPMMAASLLTDRDVVLDNVPYIKDVDVMVEILKDLGAKVIKDKRKLIINSSLVNKTSINAKLVQRLRASVLFLGPLLARNGKITLRHPGGDIIGRRGVDSHLKAFKMAGVKIDRDDLVYQAKINRKKGGYVFLEEPTVTGTENLMMYSALIDSETIIDNAACEPHIVCLAELLIKMGAKIEGAGTSRIRIVGKKKLQGAQHKIHPDFIEAGTFAILAALTGGKLKIDSIIEKDMNMIGIVLCRMGVEVKIENSSLLVNAESIKFLNRRIQAGPWPQFPTDLMSPFIVLATQTKGQTLCHDPMYESRMFFVDKLINMGAKITICDPHRVIVYGPTQLYGRHLSSPDIRAGIALVIAASIAKGESVIDNAEIIERGYENLEKRLSSVGASIKKQG